VIYFLYNVLHNIFPSNKYDYPVTLPEGTEMFVGRHAECPPCLTDVNRNCTVAINFSETLNIKFHKNLSEVLDQKKNVGRIS
jgi:hypothetical protein